jgi:endonuclease/exonuclease/phosphatase family metal-dependent hydrolase
MQIRVLTWNLFHGRDGPPDPALFTRRSEWLRITERNATHVQVNRDLYSQYARLLSSAAWDIALLQECPPRWRRRLERDCGADAHRVLTARNWFHPLSGWLATLNPDLIGAWEGGSNTTLVRGAAGEIAERRALVLYRRLPERRTLAFTRLGSGLCVANLHATTRWQRAADQVLRAAAQAVAWAEGSPLIFGGDFNVRPHQSGVYDELRERFGLARPTAPDSIDHLLARGVEQLEPPRPWPEEAREIRFEGLALRLSDHAPVEALFRIA